MLPRFQLPRCAWTRVYATTKFSSKQGRSEPGAARSGEERIAEQRDGASAIERERKRRSSVEDKERAEVREEEKEARSRSSFIVETTEILGAARCRVIEATRRVVRSASERRNRDDTVQNRGESPKGTKERENASHRLGSSGRGCGDRGDRESLERNVGREKRRKERKKEIRGAREKGRGGKRARKRNDQQRNGSVASTEPRQLFLGPSVLRRRARQTSGTHRAKRNRYKATRNRRNSEKKVFERGPARYNPFGGHVYRAKSAAQTFWRIF